MKDKELTIIAQGFYGNKTCTTVKEKNLDQFVMGRIAPVAYVGEEYVDRTIVKVPNTENIVIIYNGLEEEKVFHDERWIKAFGDKPKPIGKPLAVIPELNLKIYSRCIVCRMNENGELESIRPEDLDKFMKYLAD